IQEGDVVEKLQTSMQSGKSIYDGWISDSDLIGTHYRYGKIMPLTDYMAGTGKEYTNPGLDLKDFIGTSFTTAPDGKLYQLPDQQFANLYWFRADLFARKDLQEKFKAKYGYELGAPVGASVARGGATNSPAAVFALTKYVDWMKKYAPKEASGMTFGEAGPVPAQGQIAQQIFWYTAFTADMTKKGLPVVNEDGTP